MPKFRISFKSNLQKEPEITIQIKWLLEDKWLILLLKYLEDTEVLR